MAGAIAARVQQFLEHHQNAVKCTPARGPLAQHAATTPSTYIIIVSPIPGSRINPN